MKLEELRESKARLEEYAFALDWYEDHRNADRAQVGRLAQKYPFEGLAWRLSKEDNFGPMTSWSKSEKALRTYSTGKPKSERITGLDLEAVARAVLPIDPKNVELQEIIAAQEVIRLDTNT